MMQKKTRIVIVITMLLLVGILMIQLYRENIESIFGVIAIIWLMIFIVIGHYFIFIKPVIRNREDFWIIKDRLIRSTFWLLLIIFIILFSLWSWWLISSHRQNIEVLEWEKSEEMIRDQNKLNDQIDLDNDIKLVADLLNTSSWYLTTEALGGSKILLGDSFKSSNDNEDFYLLWNTTGLNTNITYLIRYDQKYLDKLSWWRDVQYMSLVVTSKEPQNEFCKKVRIEDSLKNLAVIYEFAPQCLSTCEKLQQVIIKWGNNLSKDDLVKISPACAESFVQ